jgi:hypothetical protein
MRTAKYIPLLMTFLLFLVTLSPANADEYKKMPRKPGEPRELTKKEQLRVEGYMNYLSFALYRYYCINGGYPSSMKQLLNSGLVVFWPINPLTNKPSRIIRDIREGEYQYAGDICYVYESGKSAFFKGHFETTRWDGWKYHEFPQIIESEKYKELIKKNPESYTEKQPYRSAKSIVGIFGTLKDIHMEKDTGELPVSTEDLFGNHFRIIREYYKPVYTGEDSKEGGFFDLGVDLQDGFWYSVYKIRPDYTNWFAHKFPWKGLSFVEREFTDTDFPKLSGQTPLLSSYVHTDVSKLPEKILISVDDIEFVLD